MSAQHFIEQIIEDDLASNAVSKDLLRFRFPPEPNGCLHIGHAKSLFLNFGLGELHRAPVNLRFDDTNPEKEEAEYVKSIKADVSWLNCKWDKECYASDYFQQLYDWAIHLIKIDKAYVDSQSSEAIANQKGTPTTPGVQSPYRNRSATENLELFEGMRQGKFPEGTHVLRAKIDMASPNMLMRDPLMYRINYKTHHRTANSWCIYPMYDWAHGQSDYLEGVSHSLCTLEFAMHRELYNWFLEVIDPDKKNIHPKQYEFARLNMSYTIMSKRKLAKLVQEGVVTAWDDPRMPTISGLRRRGYTPEAIQKFCSTVGVAKRDNLIDIALLEFCIREHLNKEAPRVMVVLNPIKVVITNYPKSQECEWLEAENNPEHELVTYRKVPFSGELFIEREDFMEEANAKFFRLKLGGEVRLKNAYIIKAERVVKNSNGDIVEIHCTYDPKSKSGSGSAESLKKVKGTLHWVSQNHAIKVTARIYERLFSHPEPDSQEDDFMNYINPESLRVMDGFAEPSLALAKPEDKYQFQRLGYFCLDKSSTAEGLVFNKTVGLKETWKNNSQTTA